MRRKWLVVVAAIAVTLPAYPSSAATTPVQGLRTANPTPNQTAFIEALSAIPAAVDALASARKNLTGSQVRRALARSLAEVRSDEFATASDDLHEQILARTHAELAAARAQESVDDLARQMYASGGSVPSLVDVMLTSESEDGLMRSLATRQYLSSAAGDRVQAGQSAVDAASSAESGRIFAESTWTAAYANWALAAGGLAEADRDKAAAQAALGTANKAYRKLMDITSTDHSADYGKVKKCGDWLTKLLSKTGFKGEDLREAWAIVMRESGGREDAISVSKDLGLFQINTATWQDQPWFDRESLLTRKFNAKVGFLLSQGGESWYSWGLDGHGRPDAGAYVKSGWSQERIIAKIINPYVLWYSLYPCRPAYEQNAWLGLPMDIVEASKPRADDTGEEPLTTGGGGQQGAPTSSAEPAPIATGPPTPSPEPASPEPSIVDDSLMATPNPTQTPVPTDLAPSATSP